MRLDSGNTSYKRVTILLVVFAMSFPFLSRLEAFVNEAISYALEAATPYVEQGFEVREDSWSGEVAPMKPLLVRHQLFRGNEYWFWAGTSWPGATVKVDIFDIEGNPVSLESFQKDSFAGARALPEKTATYLIRVVVSYDEEAAAKIEAENPGVEGIGEFSGMLDWGLVYGYR
ncbi:MAG: hypothetical protein P1U68_00490 [Verrucomicrobiales bacterium]|nr:hypothetical protein [Verrucomicrobiales bacterium]